MLVDNNNMTSNSAVALCNRATREGRAGGGGGEGVDRSDSDRIWPHFKGEYLA